MTSLPTVDKPRRRSIWPRGRLPPAIAIDLGSVRTRAWTPEAGLLFDVPTLNTSGHGHRHPVRRGAIVDVNAAAHLVERLLGNAARQPPMVVMTVPVLSDESHRNAALTAVDVLNPSHVLTIDSVKAAALGARADLSNPLLAIDIGAHLTEVALLVEGAVTHARSTCLGTSDLDGMTTVCQLVRSIVSAMTDLLHEDCGPQLVDALDLGPLLTGGGAFRPEITYQFARQLRTTVHPAASPQTAAVRGAGLLGQAARGHPGAAQLC